MFWFLLAGLVLISLGTITVWTGMKDQTPY